VARLVHKQTLVQAIGLLLGVTQTMCEYYATTPFPLFNPADFSSNGGRTLPNGVAVTGALTVDLCTSACQAQGYTLAGVEYAGECCKY
jgi:hypothetical protein